MWIIFGPGGCWVAVGEAALVLIIVSLYPSTLAYACAGAVVYSTFVVLGIRLWYRIHPYCKRCGMKMAECQLLCHRNKRTKSG